MLQTDRILANTFVASVECHETLDSTNNRAIKCAGASDRQWPLLIVAEEQTAGRGRGGNRWWTGPGSLAFSLLLGPEHLGAVRPRIQPLLALAAGIAVTESCLPLLPGHPLGIHWPNDVMAAGRKLAGILTEVLPGAHIIGIGVNTNNTMADAPPELHGAASTIRDLMGQTCDSTETLITILQRLDVWLARLRASPAEVAARADELCLQRGRLLTATSGQQIITGRCLGIAADGALRLETPEGERLVYSGVVRDEVRS
jgi:BirA family transcriptional regulator, biotin operon repressor / biotin---[acetyl-CoA-carboxylase] ligase